MIDVLFTVSEIKAMLKSGELPRIHYDSDFNIELLSFFGTLQRLQREHTDDSSYIFPEVEEYILAHHR